jgi:hypothetical protein
MSRIFKQNILEVCPRARQAAHVTHLCVRCASAVYILCVFFLRHETRKLWKLRFQQQLDAVCATSRQR